MDATIEPATMTTRSARLLVVTVGAAVPVLAASVAWWLGIPFVAAILAGGAVAGPLAAVRRANRLVGPRWLPVAIVSGIEAPFLAAGVVLLVAIIGAAWSPGDSGGLEYAAFGALFMLLYATIFGLPVALPVAVVAGFLVRRAALLGPERARRHVALLVVVAAGAGVISLAGVTGVLESVAPDLRPIDWAERSAAVRLELTIENRTSEEPELEVGWRLSDGSTGWLAGAPACTRTTDRYLLEGAEWYVARTTDDGVEPEGGVPIVTAAEWPGQDVAITVIIDSDSTRVVPGVSSADASSEAISGCPASS